MIILDTNVVSEPMRPQGNPAVRDWLDQQVAETLYLTATSLSELLLGVEILPDGKRKEGLAAALTELIEELFGSRILPFDHQAAAVYAPLIRRARADGQAISMADGQIAAVATLHGFTVATRDTAPFAAAGVPVINPWEATPHPASPSIKSSPAVRIGLWPRKKAVKKHSAPPHGGESGQLPITDQRASLAVTAAATF